MPRSVLITGFTGHGDPWDCSDRSGPAALRKPAKSLLGNCPQRGLDWKIRHLSPVAIRRQPDIPLKTKEAVLSRESLSPIHCCLDIVKGTDVYFVREVCGGPLFCRMRESFPPWVAGPQIGLLLARKRHETRSVETAIPFFAGPRRQGKANE